MMKSRKIFIVVLILIAVGFLRFNNLTNKGDYMNVYNYIMTKSDSCKGLSPQDVLKDGNGIMFVETTNRMEPISLVLCSLESAARVYPDRPVVYFMQGLGDITTWDEQMETRKRFPVLSEFPNIYYFPLRMGELLKHTPLQPWFERTDPKQEKYWMHVASDACRTSLMWRYGGLYMDTDIISLRPIHLDYFVVGEVPTATSCSVFAFSPFHPIVWEFMKNFVENYRGEIWGHQGPGVFTRVVEKMCGLPNLTSKQDMKCLDLPYLHPQRFGPIIGWEPYYSVWKKDPDFDTSYGLHMWNYQNKRRTELETGSNTLAEHIYQKYCPTTYKYLVEKQKSKSKDKPKSQNNV